MKAIQFNQQQVEAYKNGATMFVVPIQEGIFIHNGTVTFDNKTKCWSKSDYIEAFFPLQIGDEFFIQEDFAKWGRRIFYRADNTTSDSFLHMVGSKWQEASQMQEHQSRFTDLNCVNVEVKRVQDIWHNEYALMGKPIITHDKYFRKSFNEQFDVNYDKNPCVFLITSRGKGN